MTHTPCGPGRAEGGSPRAELTRLPNALACHWEPRPEAARLARGAEAQESVLAGAGGPVVSRLGEGWLGPLQAKLVGEPR